MIPRNLFTNTVYEDIENGDNVYKWPLNERICILCYSAEIEKENHFICVHSQQYGII